MSHESLVRQWLDWLDTVPNEFLFLLVLPLLVAIAGLARHAIDAAARRAYGGGQAPRERPLPAAPRVPH